MSNKAVVNGELRHVSASQIITFDRCKRKWVAQKVLCLPEGPPTDALATGTKLHSQMEDYILFGRIPEHPSAALAAAYLPPITPEVQSETPLEDPDLLAADVKVKGFIDLLYPIPNGIYIGDFKSTGSLAYAKTEEELAQNTQLMLYAKWADKKYSATDYKLEHIYLTTKGVPRVKGVSVTVQKPQVEDYFGGIESTVTAMKAAASATRMEDVEPNYDACNDYFKPCPYLSTCQPTLHQRRAALFEREEKMSLSEKLKGSTPAVGVVPPDAAIPEELKANSTPPPATGSTGFTLFVDCVPDLDEPYTSLEEYTYELADEVAKERGVTDIRLITYGQGKGYLAAAARAKPPKGYIVGRSGELTSVVVEAIWPLADKGSARGC